jgi:hypothetical protein
MSAMRSVRYALAIELHHGQGNRRLCRRSILSSLRSRTTWSNLIVPLCNRLHIVLYPDYLIKGSSDPVNVPVAESADVDSPSPWKIHVMLVD